jgi:oligoribonuclease (3'-5' exoribonuclease)
MSIADIPTFGLAIDWETSGFSTPDYTAHHQGISYGAIIFEVKTLQPVESIYHEILFDPKYEWAAGAERVHGLSRDHLKKYGVPAEKAAEDLANLVIKYIGTEDIALLGHRVHFDKAFTVQLMKTIGISFNYHPTYFDSASMATVLMETSKSEEVFQTLGLPPRATHNALEDITHTLSAIARMKEIFLKGVVAELSE